MGTCTITLDDRAFASEVAARQQQRGQRIIRGTMAASSSYATDGDLADLSNYFPAGKYRVQLSALSTTGVTLGVYDHANKKLKVYTALTTESGNVDQSVNGVFSFVAFGE